MQRALLIAEKPSLMREIEAVYKKHKSEIPYEITFKAQRGHLVTLKLPSELDEEQKNWKWENLPFHPEKHGGWQYKIIQEKHVGKNMTSAERYEDIKKELKYGKYDFVINAGDPDQEGELLIRSVLEHQKNTLPVKRFWTNDLTESAILNALKHLRDDDTEDFLVNLYAASKGRQHADYRLGMNISEAASLKMNGRVAVGRVKAPILSMVCKREEEIRNFKPHTVYGVQSVYTEGFTGSLFDASTAGEEDGEDEEKKSGIVWFETKKEAEELIKALSRIAKVVSFEKKKKETYAPKLYKLASLQIDAGKLGYNDARTLEIIQSLYEKKILSYPRTDCEYVSSKEDFISIVKSAMSVPDLVPFIKTISGSAIEKVRKTKKWVNDKALEESGHSAIIPTSVKPDFNALTKEEQDIYRLVCKRLVAIFLPPLTQDMTKMITDVEGHTFRSTGKTLVHPGYTALYGTKFTDMAIPEKKAGEVLSVEKYDIPEKTSVCPKRYTSPGIIEACENPAKFLDDPALKALGKRLKIGTPATRSGIIRRLIDYDKYLAEKKEKSTIYIVPTVAGEIIYKNLGSTDVCKVDTTGIWEEKLEDIRQGKMTLPAFESEMQLHVETLIQEIKDMTVTAMPTKKITVTPIGTCPKCGKELIESEKGYSCRGYKDGCQLKLWKNKWNADFSVEEFFKLINGNNIRKVVTISGVTEEKELTYDLKSYDIIPAGTTWISIGSCKDGDIEMSEQIFRCLDGNWQCYRNVCGAILSGDEFMSLVNGKTIIKTCRKEKEDGMISTWEQKIVFNKKTHRIEFLRETGDATEYKCPCCKKGKIGVITFTSMEGKEEKKHSCSNAKCGFTMWPTRGSYRFTESDIKHLLNGEDTEVYDMVSSAGKNYKAHFTIDKKKKKVEMMFE